MRKLYIDFDGVLGSAEKREVFPNTKELLMELKKNFDVAVVSTFPVQEIETIFEGQLGFGMSGRVAFVYTIPVGQLHVSKFAVPFYNPASLLNALQAL